MYPIAYPIGCGVPNTFLGGQRLVSLRGSALQCETYTLTSALRSQTDAFGTINFRRILVLAYPSMKKFQTSIYSSLPWSTFLNLFWTFRFRCLAKSLVTRFGMSDPCRRRSGTFWIGVRVVSDFVDAFLHWFGQYWEEAWASVSNDPNPNAYPKLWLVPQRHRCMVAICVSLSN